MSVSIYFHAVIPVDGDAYRKHKAVVDACKAAGVSIPAESASFFGHAGSVEEREVTEKGILVNIRGRGLAVEDDVMYGDGAVIDLAKLPPGATKIRVTAG